MMTPLKTILFGAFPLATLALTLFAFFFGQSEVPIWYSLSVPESQLGPRIALFIFPLSMAIIAILHSFWSKITHAVDPTLGRIVAWSAMLPLSILTIALIHIVVITL